MSDSNKFCEWVILILASASILCIPPVFCGCRRTNPEWLSSDTNEEHLSAPIISFVPGSTSLVARWNESLVTVYDQCYDEVQLWVEKEDPITNEIQETLELCKKEYKKNKDSEENSASSSNCSFEGKNIFCGENGGDVTFWVSLVYINHRLGAQTIQAPSVLAIESKKFSIDNPGLQSLICDSNADSASNENADPIELVGSKRHSTSCKALIPSWKDSSIEGDSNTNFTPNITYPSGSRGYSKTIFSFAPELLINHAKCIQRFSLKYWEQKPNGRRQSSYITEKFDQDDNGGASIRLDTRKCQSYKYKLKAEKSDPEYSISTTGYFESKCRKTSNGKNEI
jgi:hypothetical protein